MAGQLHSNALGLCDGRQRDSVSFVKVLNELDDTFTGRRLVDLLLGIVKGLIEMLPSGFTQRFYYRPQGPLILPFQRLWIPPDPFAFH